VAVDSSGQIYVVGKAAGSDFPTTPGAYQTTGTSDAFVTKLGNSASSIVYSTRLGGYLSDEAQGVAFDGTGAVYLTGQTFSSDFPMAGAFQSEFGGATDGFVAILDATGSTLSFSSFLGGSGNENNFGSAIALGQAGGVYVAGSTNSSSFPTSSALQPAAGGSGDGFILKLGQPSLNFWIASHEPTGMKRERASTVRPTQQAGRR
jgi:hypothetical protein